MFPRRLHYFHWLKHGLLPISNNSWLASPSKKQLWIHIYCCVPGKRGLNQKPLPECWQEDTPRPFSPLKRWAIQFGIEGWIQCVENPVRSDRTGWRLQLLCVKVPHARSPPFNCPHATEISEPHVRWHATIYTHTYLTKVSLIDVIRTLLNIFLFFRGF